MPTRLFKWAFVVLVGLAWVSQRYGDVTLVWHKWNGYAILILLVFRVLWGAVGSSTARFSSWVRWPWAALRYGVDLLRGVKRRPYLGHNPLGAWMILVLLAVVAVQAVAGLFTVDSNGIFGGPFANLDAEADPTPAQRALSLFHHNAYNYLLALIAVHVAANLLYQFVRRDPVVTAMVTGRKPAEDFADAPAMVRAPAWAARALGCLAVAAMIVLGTIRLAGGTLS